MILKIIKAGSSTGYKFSLFDYILCTIFYFIDIRNQRFLSSDFAKACDVVCHKPQVATYAVIRAEAITIARARIVNKIVSCPNCGDIKKITVRHLINGIIPESCKCGYIGRQIIDGTFKKDKMLSTLWSNPLEAPSPEGLGECRDDRGCSIHGI
jgi:hypothetical protein